MSVKIYMTKLLTGSSSVIAIALPAHSISLNNGQASDTNAVAEIYDQQNQYSNVVWVSPGCTGTLINSRTVLTAAHCYYGQNNDPNKFNPPSDMEIRFGPDARDDAPRTQYDQKASGIVTQQYKFDTAGNDMALITLSTPVVVNAIQAVTLIDPNAPIPSKGSTMVIVGYGAYGTGSDGQNYANGEPNNSRRRSGQTILGGYVWWTLGNREAGSFPYFVAQFRNPNSPGTPDEYGLAKQGIPVPLQQAGTGRGDSGGPLFLVKPDGSLVQIGVLSNEEPDSKGNIGYGSISGWVAVQDYYDWLKTNNPLREVSALAGDQNWSNPSAWSEGIVPNNIQGSFSGPGGDAGRFFDVALSEPGTVSVDMSPQIDGLVVNGIRSVLDVQSGNNLQVITGTELQAGRIVADGTLTTPYLQLSSGMLSGTGTISIHNYGVLGTGSGLLNNGGVIAPGSETAIGTLTVAGGGFAQKAEGLLSVRLQDREADRLVVEGEAQLGGTLEIGGMGRSVSLRNPYTVLSAQNIIGVFQTINSNFTFLTADIKYTSDTVTAMLERNGIAFADVSRTFNQRSVAIASDSLADTNPIYGALISLDTASAQAAFNRLSGEIHASTQSALIEDSHFVRDAENDRLRVAFNSVGASSAPVSIYGTKGIDSTRAMVKDLAVWTRGFGAWGHIATDGNASRLDRTTRGFLAGGDIAVDETWRLGLLGGYSRTSFSIDGVGSGGSSDNYHLGLYAGNIWGALALRSGLTYTWHQIKTGRSIAFADFWNNLSASYNADTFQAFGELGYRIGIPMAAIEPYANLIHVSVRSDGFSENGGAAALSSSGRAIDTTFSTLGLRTAADFPVGSISTTVRGGIAWRHAFGAITPEMPLAYAEGPLFITKGITIAKNTALLEGGLAMRFTDQATLTLNYQGQILSVAQEHGFNARLNVQF